MTKGHYLVLEHKGTQTIDTSRLTLRQCVPSDALHMFKNWASDSEVTKYTTWPTFKTVDTVHEFIVHAREDYNDRNFYFWVVVLKTIGQPIGAIGVMDHNDTALRAEVEYCIGRHWWYQGFASEALGAVINFLFSEVRFNRIEARHDTRNSRSENVMLRCGMHYEYTAKEADHNNRGTCDTARYVILRHEFDERSTLMKDYNPVMLWSAIVATPLSGLLWALSLPTASVAVGVLFLLVCLVSGVREDAK